MTEKVYQFFLREADVGRPRASVTAPRLAELNSYVPIKILEGAGEITPDMVAPYQAGLGNLFWELPRLTSKVGGGVDEYDDLEASRD